MRTFAFGFTALTLLLAGCAPPSDVAAPAAAPGMAAGTVQANGRIYAKPALWMVKDADTTLYLFGTVHVLRPNIDWFGGKVKQAYDASGEVVLEAVAPTASADVARTFQSLAVDPDGPALSLKLDPALRRRYLAAMEAAGLPPEQFEIFEPWFVASQLGLAPLGKLGYSAESGVESALTQAAKSAGKPILGLETFEQQLGIFDGLAEPLQIRLLASTIDEAPQAETVFAQLIDAWVKGDANRLARLMNEGMFETPQVAKLLLTDRNARWAQWIDDRMDRPGASFVAVGAGHLAGADSVQAMLGKRGLRVTRLQ